MTELDLPSSITTIGPSAFASNQFTSLVIPETVTTIGNQAFHYNELLTSVTLPSMLTSISYGCFEESGLTSIDIPDTVTSIGAYAFRGNQLTSVDIPDSVTEIGMYAFWDNQLTNVTIPQSITTMDIGVFAYNQLTHVDWPSGITEIPDATFESNAMTNLTVPSHVTRIGDSAYSYNQLTDVTIPGSVTTIANSAFRNNNLASVDIPASVTLLGDWAFAENHLASIAIPASLTEIGIGTFSGNQLTSVTIPANITYIDSRAFDANPNLAEVTFAGNAPAIVAAGEETYEDEMLGTVTYQNGSFGVPAGKVLKYSSNATGFTSPEWQGYATELLGGGPSVSPSPSVSESGTPTSTPTSSASESASPSPSVSASDSATPTSTPTPSDSQSASPSATPSESSATPSDSISPSPSGSLPPQPSPSPTGSLTFAAAPTPLITGTTRVGRTLTAQVGMWSPTPQFSYRWYRDGILVPDATSNTYELSYQDLGKSIKVKVTGDQAGYTTVTKTSAATSAIAAGTLTTYTPTISGKRSVGQTLTAQPGAWAPAPLTIRYQWYRDGSAISGATLSTYKLTAADLAKVIKVKVKGTRVGYTSATRTSAGTSPIARGTFSSSTTKITGTVKVGYTLKASLSWSPTPSKYTYRWYRNGEAIRGATASTYKLVSADAGQQIKLKVTGSREGTTPSQRSPARPTRSL